MIADTGGLYALYDTSDRHHRSAVAAFDSEPRTLIVPSLVAVEVDQLLLRRIGIDAELAFLRGLTTSYDIAHPSMTQFERARALIEQYRDLELGLVDAIVMAIAEDLRCPRILGVDRRNFMAVSPLHVGHFTLVGMAS